MVITITHSNLDATRRAGLLYTLWRLATWPAAPACWGCRIIDSNNFSLLHIHAWSDPNDDFSHLNWKRGRGRISAISIIEIDFCNFIERFGYLHFILFFLWKMSLKVCNESISRKNLHLDFHGLRNSWLTFWLSKSDETKV